MRRLRLLSLLAALPLAAAACGDVEDGTVVNDEDPLSSENGISSNGISSNGISSNGISSNALTSNALSSNALSSNGAVLAQLRDPSSVGDRTRMFFRYVVNCALPTNHAVTYTWNDSAGVKHTEINPGGLGLASGWATGGITQSEKEVISACLGARTNALGIAVPLSLRAKGGALSVSAQERADYSYGDGSFWGNLFNNGSPYLYACSRSPFNTGATSSRYTAQGRTCASQGCGIITSVGFCFTSDLNLAGQGCYERSGSGEWVSRCGPALSAFAGSNSSNVISVWLKP